MTNRVPQTTADRAVRWLKILEWLGAHRDELLAIDKGHLTIHFAGADAVTFDVTRHEVATWPGDDGGGERGTWYGIADLRYTPHR